MDNIRIYLNVLRFDAWNLLKCSGGGFEHRACCGHGNKVAGDMKDGKFVHQI
jgi:hypothetical protein